MKCPKCDFGNPSGTRFCGNCAAPLSLEKTVSLTETVQLPVMEMTPGSTFARRYQIIEDLGKGGMGRVYKAYDTEVREKLALKLLRPDIADDERNDRALPERAEAGPPNLPPEHLPDVRFRPRGRDVLHHDGICPGRGPQEPDPPDRRAARGQSRQHRRSGRRGPLRGPPPGRRPSGPQAAEYHDRPRGQRPHHGFRDRPIAVGKGDNGRRHDNRHAGIHVARASGREGSRPTLRHLFIRNHSL